jgi:formylglycine-generating enzyme required for sulfatase activity
MSLGCGSSTPDLAEIRKLMTSEQRSVGDPIVNSVGMVLVPVPVGEFQMGTPIDISSPEERYERLLEKPDVAQKLDSGELTKEALLNRLKRAAEEDRRHKGGIETPQHLVEISKPFFIGSFEVTQQQFAEVMDSQPWQGQPLVEIGPDYAATYITWDHAVEFCRRLSDQERAEYRLPTEAEWEYACRAGTTTQYSFGDERHKLANYAWHDENAYKAGEQYPHRVGQKLPNAWVLYDVHGNVWEWCADWYGPYSGKLDEAIVDPTGPENGRHRVWRGGSFSESAENTRSASRLSFGRVGYRPEFAAGFRVVRTF